MFTTEIIAFLGLLLTSFGSGITWVVNRIDKKSAERDKDFQDRILKLETKVNALELKEYIYIKRIYDLELEMKTLKLPLPITEGWPIHALQMR